MDDYSKAEALSLSFSRRVVSPSAMGVHILLLVTVPFSFTGSFNNGGGRKGRESYVVRLRLSSAEVKSPVVNCSMSLS